MRGLLDIVLPLIVIAAMSALAGVLGTCEFVRDAGSFKRVPRSNHVAVVPLSAAQSAGP